MLINVKMPTIVGILTPIIGILTFMSRINFVLSCIEHGKSFITSGPDFGASEQQRHSASAFVTRYMESIMAKLDTCKISIF